MIEKKLKTEEIYIPRKCSFSNKILPSKDFSSTQISIGLINKNGNYNGKNKIFAFNGFFRRNGKIDYALNILAEENDNFN